MTNEQISKAKECKSAEELLSLAKENGIEMTAEEAEAKFAQLNNEGELSDDELSGAAGGGCGGKETPQFEYTYTPEGYRIVTHNDYCNNWKCRRCGDYRSCDCASFASRCWDCKHYVANGGYCKCPENNKNYVDPYR